MTKEQIRKFVEKALKDRGISFSSASETVGKSHAYIQQYVRRGVPDALPEDVRPLMAKLIECDELALKPNKELLTDVKKGVPDKTSLIIPELPSAKQKELDMTDEEIDIVQKFRKLTSDRRFMVVSVISQQLADQRTLQRVKHEEAEPAE